MKTSSRAISIVVVFVLCGILNMYLAAVIDRTETTKTLDITDLPRFA